MLQSHEGSLDPIGSVIGPWRITKSLGTRGETQVYQAERDDDQFDRQVAFRFLKSENEQHLRQRFEEAARALAHLRHPNIAQLHDSGLTGEGRPYLIADLVDGTNLYDFCRKIRATVSQRLQLFLQICDAVAEAHRNLIVHRNLNQENILVDETGQVKLLDFGLSDLMKQSPGEEAVTEDLRQLAEILHQLLAEACVFSDSQKQLLPATRAAFPMRDAEALPADLFAVLRRALGADPTGDYQTVEAITAECRRYLEGFPVEAQGGNPLYRLRRFVGRHPTGCALGTLLSLGLILLIGTQLVQGQQLAQERDLARDEEQRALAVVGFFREVMAGAEARDASLRDLLVKAVPKLDDGLDRVPLVRLDLLETMSRSLVHLSELEHGLDLSVRRLDDSRRLMGAHSLEYGDALVDLGNAFFSSGEYELALEYVHMGRDIQLTHLGHDHPRLALTEKLRGHIYSRLGQPYRGLEILCDVVDLYNSSPELEGKRKGSAYLTIAQIAGVVESDLSIPFARRAVDTYTRFYGRRHALTATALNTLGTETLHKEGPRYARPLLEEALSIAEEHLGKNSLMAATILYNLAQVESYDGKPELTFEMRMRALKIQELNFGADNLQYGRYMINLGFDAQNLKWHAVADAIFTYSLEIMTQHLEPDNFWFASPYTGMAVNYDGWQRYPEAIKYYDMAIALRERQLPPGHLWTAELRFFKGMVLYRTGAHVLGEEIITTNLDLIRKTDNYSFYAYYLIEYGKLLNEFKRFQEARCQLDLAREYWKYLTDEERRDLCESGILAAERLGQTEEAETYWEMLAKLPDPGE